VTRPRRRSDGQSAARRRAPAEHERGEHGVREAHRHVHALRRVDAPAPGDVPQHPEQAQLDEWELGDRHVQVELVRAPLRAPDELVDDLRPAAHEAAEALVEDRDVAGLDHLPLDLHRERAGMRVGLPRTEQVARPEQLRIRDPPEAHAPRDHAVEDEQAHHVVARLETGRPVPAPERPDRDDEPAAHLLVQRGREAPPEALVQVEQRRHPAVAEGCGDRPRDVRASDSWTGSEHLTRPAPVATPASRVQRPPGGGARGESCAPPAVRGRARAGHPGFDRSPIRCPGAPTRCLNVAAARSGAARGQSSARAAPPP
jgi:hypothetical protein